MTDLFTASLALSVTGAMDAPRLEQVRPWLNGVARRGARVVPAMLTVDVGTMLVEGPRSLQLPEVGSQDDLRSALTAYAEHIVGRVRSEPALLALNDAVAGCPAPALAVQAVVTRLAGKLLDAERFGERSVARKSVTRPATELMDDAHRALSMSAIREQLADGIIQLVKAAKRQPSLLLNTDAFVVRHIDALQNPSDQLAFAQVADAAEALARRVPLRVRARRPPGGSATTSLNDDSAYPVGGYSSLATHGPLENLVSSELVYLEPEAELDLFDLRYATGELLKYTRDESLWTRAYRRIDFVLTDDVLNLKVKVPELPFQCAVMAQGGVVVCLQRLVDWLSANDLALRLWIHDPDAMHGDDLARLRLVLADYLALGVLEIDSFRSWDELLTNEDTTDVVVFDTAPPPVGRGLVVHADGRVEGPLVTANTPTFGPRTSSEPDESIGLRGWSDRLTELLQQMI